MSPASHYAYGLARGLRDAAEVAACRVLTAPLYVAAGVFVAAGLPLVVVLHWLDARGGDNG